MKIQCLVNDMVGRTYSRLEWDARGVIGDEKEELRCWTQHSLHVHEIQATVVSIERGCWRSAVVVR